MRVLLADPPLIIDNLERNYPNLGLLYLISYARHRLDGVEFRYRPADDDLDGLIKAIDEFRPDLLGLSFTSIGKTNAYAAIDGVKERFPELPIICGGAHATIAPEEVLTETAADYCAIGEGEATFADVLRLRRGELKPQDVAGLAWREAGRVKFSPPRPPLADLDEIPIPAWNLIGLDEFLGPQVRKNSPATAVLASRGCPFRCVFCSNPVWKAARPHYRHRSPDNLAAEIALLYEKGFRELYIRSDEMNIDLDWALAVCRAIKALGVDDMAFQMNLRADKMTDELADALAEIDCWLVHLGIESGNDRVLKGIKKHITTAQVESTCRTLKARGIKVFGFMMMFQAWEEDGRLNYETVEEVEQSLKFVRRLVGERLLDYMSWQVATPVPGAELYDIVKRHGLMKEGPRVRNMWELHFDLPGVDEKTLKRLRLKGMLLQSYLYLKSGRIQWRHWRKIADKIVSMIRSV